MFVFVTIVHIPTPPVTIKVETFVEPPHTEDFTKEIPGINGCLHLFALGCIHLIWKLGVVSMFIFHILKGYVNIGIVFSYIRNS